MRLSHETQIGDVVIILEAETTFATETWGDALNALRSLKKEPVFAEATPIPERPDSRRPEVM